MCASPYAADEIGLALRLSRGTAAVRLMQAQRLDGELAATRQAWQDGAIDATKVRAVLDATVNLDAGHVDCGAGPGVGPGSGADGRPVAGGVGAGGDRC